VVQELEAFVCETGGTYTVLVTLGVQVHDPSDFVQDVEDGFSPNWPPGPTDELKNAGGAVYVLVPWDGLTGARVTELAGALVGTGAGAADDEGDEGGMFDEAGPGTWLEGAGTMVEGAA
jgi:hypothetical protein